MPFKGHSTSNAYELWSFLFNFPAWIIAGHGDGFEASHSSKVTFSQNPHAQKDPYCVWVTIGKIRRVQIKNDDKGIAITQSLHSVMVFLKYFEQLSCVPNAQYRWLDFQERRIMYWLWVENHICSDLWKLRSALWPENRLLMSFLFSFFISYFMTQCILLTGIITSFGLWLDGVQILNSSSTQRFFVVDGLHPWSRHVLRLQACTAQGCGKGPMVSPTTKHSFIHDSICGFCEVTDMYYKHHNINIC